MNAAERRMGSVFGYASKRGSAVPLTAQTPDPCERIVQAVAAVGWCVMDGFLPQPLVGALREEALGLRQSGGFHRAGVGRGTGLLLRPEVRGDDVLWLDPGQASAAQREVLDRIEALRLALNRSLFLGLFEFEGHLAVYPPGSFYRRHLDCFQGVEARTVTCVLYLNDAWSDADGGQLRLYADPVDPQAGTDIQPLGGRLVTFLSTDYPHEVLPARRERVSVTGWLKRRSGGG
jgi:SM-20-related protein